MDRLSEMEAFATVVDQGGFTDAAKKLGLSKSAISKHLSNLEARLGARLLNRTTRRVSPTEIGLVYYDRACQVINDAGEADALVTSMQETPSGPLNVAVDADFGASSVSPMIGDFLTDFPEISVNIQFSNRTLELLSDGFDAAVRIGELRDSSLRARKLTETTIRMVASPDYLDKSEAPMRLEDLNDHKLLHYSDQATPSVWKITSNTGELRQIRTAGSLSVNDGQSLLNAAIEGLGIAYLPSFLYADAMREGRVVDVMPHLPKNRQGIYLIYPPGRFMQPKVRAFIDFMVTAFASPECEVW